MRGVDTVVDGPCPAGVCQLTLKDGAFRGTPTGTGAYTGSIKLAVAAGFPNGEGGVCAPIEGEIVLGAGTLIPLPPRPLRRFLPGRRRRRHAGVVHRRHALRRQARHRDLRQDPRLRHRHLLRGCRRPRAHDPDRADLAMKARILLAGAVRSAVAAPAHADATQSVCDYNPTTKQVVIQDYSGIWSCCAAVRC